MARITMSDQLAEAQGKISELQGSIHQLLSTTDDLRRQLADRDRVHAEAIAKITSEHDKALKSKDDSYKYASQQSSAAQNELEQAHAVLDSVEGAPLRDYEGEYGRKQRNVVTRLAGAFLAIAQKHQP